MGLGQSIAFSKASHASKDYTPKGGDPDHQAAVSVNMDTVLFLRKIFTSYCRYLRTALV